MSAARHATHTAIVFSCPECRRQIPGWDEDEMDAYAAEKVKGAPPLTPDQRQALYALLHPRTR